MIFILRSFEELSNRFTSLVRSSLNDKAPIHKVPNEILCEVFASVIWVPPVSISRSSSVRPQLPYQGIRSLASLQQVCTKWVGITRSCPTLWTHVVSTHLKLESHMNAFWDRSHALPFSIVLDATHAELGYGSKALVESMSRCHSRLQRLDLFLPNHLHDFAPQCVSAAPHLKVLTISCQYRNTNSNGVQQERFAPDLPLLPLKALALRIFSRIPSDLLPALTHVHLSFPRPPMLATALYRFLHNAPQLEFTHLQGFERDNWSSETGLVPLHRLRSFKFDNCSISILTVLRHIQMGTHCVVRAERMESDVKPPSLAEVHMAKDLQVCMQEKNKIHFLVEGEHTGISLHVREVYPRRQYFIRNLTSFYPLGNIVSFTFTQFPGIGGDNDLLNLTECLLHMHSLQTLRIRLHDAQYSLQGPPGDERGKVGVIEHFCACFSSDGEYVTSPILCPVLRTLCFVCSSEGTINMELLGGMVKRMLQARAVGGAPGCEA